MIRKSDSVLIRPIFFAIVSVLLLPGLAMAAGALDSWQWRNPLPQGNPLLGVAGGPGRFVAVGDHGTIITSTNGTNWQPVAVNTTGRFYGVAEHNGLFVAGGPGIWTSSNGVAWTQRYAEFIYGVSWANGGFLALTASSPGGILTSPDGITWSEHPLGTTQLGSAVTYGNGTYVVVGGNFTNSVLLTSTDTVTWTDRAFTTDVLSGVTYGNGLFVAVGYNFYGNQGVSLTSPDGVNWTRHVIVPTWYGADVCFAQGQFVVACIEGILTSPDGSNWQKRYEEFPNSLHAVAAHSGGFIAVGNAGAIVTSPDGVNWARQTGGSWHAFYGIAAGNGTVVAVGNRGTTAISPDGVNWTHQNLGANTLMTAITHAPGRFVAVGSVYNNPVNVPKIFTSTNGLTWSQQTVSIPGYFTGITYAEGTFVATSGDGFGRQGRMLYSTNAQDWATSSGDVTNAMYGVGFGNGVFVAVGYAGTIMTSADFGKSWIRQPSGTTEGLYTVGFGNGTFVTGDVYGHVLTSTNGSQWNSQSLNGGESIYGVAYGNGTFVAVGGNTLLTSTNATQWAKRTFPSWDRLNGVIFDRGTFITVGEWGMILQSGYSGPPRLESPGRDASGFRFVVVAESGQRYRLQTATNLLNGALWSDWLEHTNAGERYEVLDTATSGPQKYYRAVRQ